jgi:biotin carboxylase
MPLPTNLPGRTLLLFNHDWDAIGHARALGGIGHPVDEDGFDLFSFPSNVRLAFFDIEHWVGRLARQAAARGWTAVASHHEQFGALAAALLAERMGWPGTTVNAVLACQHKLHARQVLQQVAPEAHVPFALLNAEYGEAVPAGLSYPAFVKPVKAAFSVLAREVRSHDELQRHTRFGAWELWVIRRLVEPFERLSRQRLGPDAPSAHRMMLEQPVHAAQYNLDGYVFEGQLHPIGVVDAVMYPGTQAFMRHQLPTRLPQAVQDRAADVARRFLAAVGFTHGLFNMEFFYDEAQDRLSVIEFNPRMASQYSDLYLRVLGIDLHAIGLALAHGVDPASLPRAVPQAGAAASFVYRQFNPNDRVVMPDGRQQQAFARTFPDGLLFCYPKSAASVARDHKWLGSWRYGIVHLAGRDEAELRQRCEQASALLGWPAPYVELPMSVAVGSSAGAPHASTLTVAPAIRAWP